MKSVEVNVENTSEIQTVEELIVNFVNENEKNKLNLRFWKRRRNRLTHRNEKEGYNDF